MNKKQEITEFILEKTKQVDFLKVLTLTGSALEKEFVENMDFLLIADQEISEEDFLKIIDIKLSSRYKDCYTFNFKDVLVNITVIGLERFDNYYGNIFYGKKIELSYSNWCLGYFLPEAFLGDIKKSKVIFEKINYSSKYKDKLNSYPALLQQEIIKTSLRDLDIMKNLFHKSLELNNSAAILASVSEIIFISLRALFAKENIYYKGLFDLDPYLSMHPEIDLSLKQINENILHRELLKEGIDNYLKTVDQILL